MTKIEAKITEILLTFNWQSKVTAIYFKNMRKKVK